MPAVQDSIDAIRIAAAAADRMKATDLVAFDVTEPLAITDAMLVATASNERQVLAVAEEIEKGPVSQKRQASTAFPRRLDRRPVGAARLW